jgi:hypothetical protein
VLCAIAGLATGSRPLAGQAALAHPARAWVAIRAAPGFEAHDIQCALVRPEDDAILLVDHVGGSIHEITARGAYVGAMPPTADPKERLQSCAYAGWTGQYLWVFDPMRARVRMVPRDRRGMAHEMPVRFPPHGDTDPGLPRGVSDSGEWIVEYAPQCPQRRPTGTVDVPVSVAGANQPPSRDIARLEFRHRVLVLRSNRFTTCISFQPFSDDPLVSVSSAAGLVVVLERRAPDSSTKTRTTVTVSDGRGQLATWSAGTASPPLTQAVVHAYIGTRAGAIGRTGRLGDSATVHQWLAESVYIPKRAPVVDGLLLGRDSTIWIRRFRGSPALDQEWSAYTISGNLVASLTAPPGLRPIEGTRAAFWGIVQDGIAEAGVLRLGARRMR